MKICVHQMSSGIDPLANAETMVSAISASSTQGVQAYFAPEMSLLLDRNRIRARDRIEAEANSEPLAMLREAAREAGIWVHIGSMPLISDNDSQYFANRSIVIDPSGMVAARYDKMHLFDVDLPTGESWRESTSYVAGKTPVVVDVGPMRLGLAICYDLRFPDLFSTLAKAGASVFAVPSAFTVPTGQAHWHLLLRARAIESAAFVIAAAQTGKHEDGRETYGHSLVVDPWGEVLLDMGEGEGLAFADIDLARVDEVRRQIPVHLNRREVPPLV